MRFVAENYAGFLLHHCHVFDHETAGLQQLVAVVNCSDDELYRTLAQKATSFGVDGLSICSSDSDDDGVWEAPSVATDDDNDDDADDYGTDDDDGDDGDDADDDADDGADGGDGDADDLAVPSAKPTYGTKHGWHSRQGGGSPTPLPTFWSKTHSDPSHSSSKHSSSHGSKHSDSAEEESPPDTRGSRQH